MLSWYNGTTQTADDAGRAYEPSITWCGAELFIPVSAVRGSEDDAGRDDGGPAEVAEPVQAQRHLVRRGTVLRHGAPHYFLPVQSRIDRTDDL